MQGGAVNVDSGLNRSDNNIKTEQLIYAKALLNCLREYYDLRPLVLKFVSKTAVYHETNFRCRYF